MQAGYARNPLVIKFKLNKLCEEIEDAAISHECVFW